MMDNLMAPRSRERGKHIDPTGRNLNCEVKYHRSMSQTATIVPRNLIRSNETKEKVEILKGSTWLN